MLILWPVLVVTAILIRIKMPGGPAFFCQKRVGKDGNLFTCFLFRSMTVLHNGSSVKVSGNSSFVGPRPDVPGYAVKVDGEDRDVLKLRPGITGPATLKYRLEDEMISEYVAKRQAEGDTRDSQVIAVEYNDTVIYPDKIRLNCYYYRNYSFWKDIEMIFATVLGKKVRYMDEEI